MVPIFDKGYDLASGYRNCKNGNKSVIAACSALTFSLVNTVFNDKKNKEKACKQLCQWSGFFPDNVHLLKKFNQIMKETAREIDLLEKWDKPCEDYFIKKYCKSMKGEKKI